jgi:single-stranded-DNA-specific exonuclease
MMKWVIRSEVKAEDTKERRKEILKAILVNRGVRSAEEAREFLKPRRPEKYSASELGVDGKMIEKALAAINGTLKEGKTAMVYGDYDADGVTATAIMSDFLSDWGLKVKTYLPERRSEGYGMKTESLKKLLAENRDLGLVVTVDQGIVAIEEAKFLHDRGVKLIVTDHHQVGKDRPVAEAVVHTTMTSGSGLAWLMSQWLEELGGTRGGSERLDLAAIGTVADMMPLAGVNRSLVTFGLKKLRVTQRLGLRRLMKLAGIEAGELEAGGISFRLAPRLNAMGRLKHAGGALELLRTKDFATAAELAEELEMTNRQRQEMTEAMWKQATEAVDKEGKLIFISDGEYDEGVIGLVAGKLVERWHRPAIVVAQGEELSKASARSIEGFNMIEALRTAEHLLESVGGHELAAGFSVATGKIEDLKQWMENQAEERLEERDLVARLEADCRVKLEDGDRGLWEIMEQLAPFGVGNSRPVLVSSGLKILNSKAVGQGGKHLRLLVKSGESGKVMGGIGFGMGDRSEEIKSGDQVEVAYNLTNNRWNGREELEMRIKDIRISN